MCSGFAGTVRFKDFRKLLFKGGGVLVPVAADLKDHFLRNKAFYITVVKS